MKFNLKHFALLSLFLLGSGFMSAQSISIAGSGTGTPHPSAILDLNDTTRGFLPPRLTTVQMNNINSPAEGLLIYNTDSSAHYFFNNITWVSVGSSNLASGELFTNNGNVGIGTTTPVFDFEVAGSEGKQISTVNVGTANQIDDLVISDTANVIRLTGANSDFDITGIVASQEGRIIYLMNVTIFEITFNSNDTDSSVGNRFFLRNGGSRTLRSFEVGIFIYSPLDGGWMLLSEN